MSFDPLAKLRRQLPPNKANYLGVGLGIGMLLALLATFWGIPRKIQRNPSTTSKNIETTANLAGSPTRFKPVSTTFDELELLAITQLNSYDRRFDLSGLVWVKGDLFAVADKEWDNQIYAVQLQPSEWRVAAAIRLNDSRYLDIEAVDFCNGIFFLASETLNKIFTADTQGRLDEIVVDFASRGLDPSKWLTNAGLEGLAVNCTEQKLYVAKERAPRFIVEVDLSTQKISTPFNVPETESNDFSDLKFENGFLYALERNGSHIAKIDPKTQQVVNKVSFRKTANPPDGRMFGPSDYGLEEALTLTPDEIWIGIDNNELMVTPRGQSFALTGSAPAIMRFKRPYGF